MRRNLFVRKWSYRIHIFVVLSTLSFSVRPQCTSCSTCSATFCDITVSADNTTDYTLSGNFAEDKMCITGGTYSGDITINGSTPTICITGGTFAPATFTNSGGYNFYLYVNSGGTATFPGNTTFPNNWYNNGTITINGNLSTTGGFPNNCGSLTVNGDFTNTASLDNCSGGTMVITGDLKNDGTFNINGNITVRDSFINTGQITGYDGVTITTKHFLNGTGSDAGQIQGPGSGIMCFNISDYSKNSNDGQVQGNVGLCDITPPGGCSSPDCIDASDGTLAGTVTNCAGTCDGSSLPIELIYFSARPTGNSILLSWVTGSEINNDYFSIQRSADGYTFHETGTVKGHGNSSEKLSYFFHDETAPDGLLYYLLKQVDYDGKYSISPSIAVMIKNNEAKIIRFTAISGEMIEYDFFAPDAMPVQSEIIDAMGNRVFYTAGFAAKGISQHIIGLSGLSEGIYLWKITAGTHVIIKRFRK